MVPAAISIAVIGNTHNRITDKKLPPNLAKGHAGDRKDSAQKKSDRGGALDGLPLH